MEQKHFHLRYDIMTAHLGYKEGRHAIDVMQELGITYQHRTPQSIAEQWWFWNCQNIPDELPGYITPMQNDPMKCIGYGLSQSDAEAIRDFVYPINNNNATN